MEKYFSEINEMIEGIKLEENYIFTFFTFNNIFCEKFKMDLEKKLKKEVTKEIINKLKLQFCNSVYALTIRTLINEFHKWQQLNTNIIKEIRYETFCNKLKTVTYVNELRKKYPVLFFKLYNLHKGTIDLVVESFFLLKNDCNELHKEFNFNFDIGLKQIQISSGDRHNNGKTVLIFEDKQGNKVLFKPHSLSNDLFFEGILSYLNKKIPLDLYHPKTINKGKYGWQEFIEYGNCTTEKQYHEYFYRYGEILAIAYCFHISDLHKENIIMSKNYPVIIDSETIFTNGNYSWKIKSSTDSIQSVFSEFTSESVLGTLLLPNNFPNTLFDVDLSPLNFNNQKSQNITKFIIKDNFSSNVRLEKEQVELICDNNLENIDKYLNNILIGFEACYKVIEKSKLRLIKLVNKLVSDNPLLIRQVLRPTMVYAKFLEASTHPDYLVNMQVQKSLFNKLNTGFYRINTILQKQVDLEIDSLIKGDVPYFYTKFQSLGIYSMEREIPNFYSKCIKDIMLEHFDKIGTKDLINQMRIIYLSLSTISNIDIEEIKYNTFEKYHLINKNNSTKLDSLGDYIFNEVIWDKNKLFCILPSITIINEKKVITPVNYYLYDGGGIILLLMYIFQKTSNRKYLIVLEGLLKGFDMMEESENDYNLSSFNGIGSIIYIYYSIYRSTLEKRYYNKYKEYLLKMAQMEIKQDQEIDYVGGLSSLLVLLCNLYKFEKEPLILDLIEKYKCFIVKKLKNIYITGFAHGFSGIALALAYYYELFPSDSNLELIKTLIRKEDNYYCSNKENWRDNREESKISFPNFWCYGAPGILLARNEIFKKTSERFYKIESVIRVQNSLMELKNLNLCHGAFGNYNCISQICEELKDEKMINKINNIFKIIKNKLDTNIDIYSMNIFSFMLGIPGIGYEVLRKKDRNINNILLLELGREE